LNSGRDVRGDDDLLFDGGYTFTVTINDSQIVTMNVPTVYSGFFGAAYDTPNGNQPTTYGNQLLVFAGGPLVPVDALPAGSAPASPGGGGYVFPAKGTSFTSQPYVCAYSVGPFSVAGGKGRYPNIAAAAYLPGGVGGTQPIQLTPSALGIQTAQTAFITWSYTLPGGVDPSANGAWIGLWYGLVSPYTVPPDFFAPIFGSASSGLSPMPGIRLTGKQNYVGALFTSGYNQSKAHLQQTAIAAVIFFTLGPPLPP
jgi:hypothetical protein